MSCFLQGSKLNCFSCAAENDLFLVCGLIDLVFVCVVEIGLVVVSGL